ncbi:MAG: secreted Zn-dependent insulinase-like peptidase [Alphaproteobacteria bacterium]
MQKHAYTTLPTNFCSLKNGLRLAFISASESHENAHKASISVTLRQGHFHAFEFPEGFAHLYEHMLFNASTKYQNVDALDNHLFAHHGQVNGWTQDASTHFQMSCDQDGFEKACDIFIDRLSSPLFLYENIEKEIITINAEFIAKKADSVRQLISVQKASCNKAHPFSAFSTGNNKTLNLLSTAQTHALLQKYHQHVMQGKHLSICIGLPNNEHDNALRSALTQQIKNAFSASNRQDYNNELGTENWEPVYLPQHLNKFIEVKQNNACHQLISSYIVAKGQCKDREKHRSKLHMMLCHLLESKHEHGLFHLLNTGKLATDIRSYCNALDAHSDELVVSIQLSDEGAQAPQTIHQYIQSYIDFLHQEKIEPWRFREKAQQLSLSLTINKGNSLLEDCIEMSQSMSKSVSENIESITTLEQVEPWLLIPDILSQLRPLHTRVYFISPLATTNMKSAHYDTPYSMGALDTNNLTPTNTPHFIKPRQNPYMAGQYPLVKKQIDATKLFHLQSMQSNFKFYQDLRLNLPNGECYISITEPEMYGSVAQLAAKRVWLSCLNEHLASTFFDAELASIHFRVYAHHHGISIHTGGLSERQLLLCIELINAIRQFKASKENIERHLNKTLSNMNNRPKQRPINQLFSRLNEYYQYNDRKQNALLIGLRALTVDAIFNQQTQYFTYNFIESLLLGNWKIEAAKRFNNLLNARFKALRSVTKPKLNSPPVVSGKHLHFPLSLNNESSFVWHYIPLLNDLEKARIADSKQLKLSLSARALVLEKLLSHTIFDVLRQQHNIGYELGVGYKPISRYPGIAMYAVSQTHSTDDIYHAMLQAIEHAKSMLVNEKVSIKEMVKELIKQVTPRETDISQTASRTWLHFEDENPILGYVELIEALTAINKEDIIKALDNLINTNLGQVTMTASANEATVAHSIAG